jgi:3-isopropylmalate dehydrogenase
MTLRIALLPGDGIGPEVIDAAARVLQTIAKQFGRTFEMRAWPIGGAALGAGHPPLPSDTLNACLGADAVLLGAVGDPRYDAEPRDRKPETALLQLRKALNVYANVRPARVWPGLEDSGPLKLDRISGTDLVIVRELTGGLYFGEPRGFDADGRAAFNTLRYSEDEVVRVSEVAFRLAQGRRKLVTSVDKANVLETSQLWRRVVSRLGERYPDVRLEHMYVDSCAMALALNPRRFDVVLTENLLGDILSDEAGAVVGSLGLLPSASLGEGPGLFEPVHGSAPDLAGRDVANPIGAIASAAMLLRALKLETAAATVERAIGSAITDGCRTADLLIGVQGTPMTCSAMAREIQNRVQGGAGLGPGLGL